MPFLIPVHPETNYGTLVRQLMFHSASFSSRYMGKINPELFSALEGMELSAEVVEQLKKNARKTQTEEDFKRTLEKLWLSKSNESRTDISFPARGTAIHIAPNGADTAEGSAQPVHGPPRRLSSI